MRYLLVPVTECLYFCGQIISWQAQAACKFRQYSIRTIYTGLSFTRTYVHNFLPQKLPQGISHFFAYGGDVDTSFIRKVDKAFPVSCTPFQPPVNTPASIFQSDVPQNNCPVALNNAFLKGYKIAWLNIEMRPFRIFSKVMDRTVICDLWYFS